MTTPNEITNFVEAAREVMATELAGMACIGSNAPAEHALGMLADALACYVAPAQPVSAADGLQALADQVVLANATSNPDLYHDAVVALVAGVRKMRQPQPFGNSVRLGKEREGRIYIAGPMTGLPDLNFPAFHAAAKSLREDGWAFIENPANHNVVDGAEWADYLAYDLTRLGLCGSVYLLPGWQNSKGARLEVHVALSLGMEIFTANGAIEPSGNAAPDDAMERALAELVDKIVPGLDTGDLVADAATASKALDREPFGNAGEPVAYLFHHNSATKMVRLAGDATVGAMKKKFRWDALVAAQAQPPGSLQLTGDEAFERWWAYQQATARNRLPGDGWFDLDECDKPQYQSCYRAALAQKASWQDREDAERLDWLTDQLVDTIYLDDGRIIDIGGSKRPHDVRLALDAARAAAKGES